MLLLVQIGVSTLMISCFHRCPVRDTLVTRIVTCGQSRGQLPAGKESNSTLYYPGWAVVLLTLITILVFNPDILCIVGHLGSRF